MWDRSNQDSVYRSQQTSLPTLSSFHSHTLAAPVTVQARQILYLLAQRSGALHRLGQTGHENDANQRSEVQIHHDQMALDGQTVHGHDALLLNAAPAILFPDVTREESNLPHL